jgi:hypothetical protein
MRHWLWEGVLLGQCALSKLAKHYEGLSKTMTEINFVMLGCLVLAEATDKCLIQFSVTFGLRKNSPFFEAKDLSAICQSRHYLGFGTYYEKYNTIYIIKQRFVLLFTTLILCN